MPTYLGGKTCSMLVFKFHILIIYYLHYKMHLTKLVCSVLGNLKERHIQCLLTQNIFESCQVHEPGSDCYIYGWRTTALFIYLLTTSHYSMFKVVYKFF